MSAPLRLIVAAVAAVALAACGSSSSPSSPSSPSPTPSVSPSGSTVTIVSGASAMSSTAYNPNPITVSRGSSVKWVNGDTVTHTSTANDGSFSSGAIAPGGSFTQTFQNAGTFPYHCTIHPNMVGTVTVQ